MISLIYKHLMMQGFINSGGADLSTTGYHNNYDLDSLMQGEETPLQIDQHRAHNEDDVKMSEENDHQMIRLIQQYLNDHGFQEVSKQLEHKSNIKMEDISMNDFRASILTGDFRLSRSILCQMCLDHNNQKEIEYLLFEQEYFELMEKGSKLEAIVILQTELMNRAQPSMRQRLYQLAQLVMIDFKQIKLDHSEQRAQKLIGWKGSGEEGRRELLIKIQNLMPPSKMLPGQRLEKLIAQSLQYQLTQCKYHNSTSNCKVSLLEDHQCQKQFMIPSKCIGILQKHRDEVWQVKFSPSGTKIVSVGKDNILYIWSITKVTKKIANGYISSQAVSKYRIKCTHEIKGHSKMINALNWSSNDAWIVTASQDNTAKVWDSKSGKLISEITKHNESVTAAAFVPNTNGLITGGVDKLLILWELRQINDQLSQGGTIQYEAIELARVQSRNYVEFAISEHRFISMGQQHISIFNCPQPLNSSQRAILNSFKECFDDSEATSRELDINDTVLSIALTRDGRYLLVNVSQKDPRLDLYDLFSVGEGQSRKPELLRKFKGSQEQRIFVIKCGFGGANESFVMCGSEDATINIWNRETGDLIAKIGSNDLQGHTQVVNATSWSPTDPYLFVSASDDQTLRVWGLESMLQSDILSDGKDFKKIDAIRFQSNQGQNHLMSQEDGKEEDIDEDQNDDEDEDEDYGQDEDEDAMDDEEFPSRLIMQTTRYDRRVQDEEEEEANEDEDQDEWAEEGQ